MQCLGEECLSLEVLVELVGHLHLDVPEDVFDDFLYVFVHIVWRLDFFLYLCSKNKH